MDQGVVRGWLIEVLLRLLFECGLIGKMTTMMRRMKEYLMVLDPIFPPGRLMILREKELI